MTYKAYISKLCKLIDKVNTDLLVGASPKSLSRDVERLNNFLFVEGIRPIQQEIERIRNETTLLRALEQEERKAKKKKGMHKA